jgi:hypothetical protein
VVGVHGVGGDHAVGVGHLVHLLVGMIREGAGEAGDAGQEALGVGARDGARGGGAGGEGATTRPLIPSIASARRVVEAAGACSRWTARHDTDPAGTACREGLERAPAPGSAGEVRRGPNEAFDTLYRRSPDLRSGPL